jgi:hypothetical protein
MVMIPRKGQMFPRSERMLPGRSPQSREHEDAARWTQLYRELMETKQTLAAYLAAAFEPAGEAARAELKSVVRPHALRRL